jgi:hypothetical protein
LILIVKGFIEVSLEIIVLTEWGIFGIPLKTANYGVEKNEIIFSLFACFPSLGCSVLLFLWV